MNQFIVVDHSIKRIGGHNYEYALHVLSAAERQGYRPILAVNRRFFESHRLPKKWQLHTVFHHTTYEVARLNGKQARLDPEGAISGGQPIKSPEATRARRRRPFVKFLPAWSRRCLVGHYQRQKQCMIDRFATDLASLFAKTEVTAGDHIFFPTLSEDDLVGLLAFWRDHRATAGRGVWHLQFHFSVYDGRPLDFEAQENCLEGLRRRFLAATRVLPSGDVRFYTTTDLLADQYNRLGSAEFRTLPYPVNPALLEKSRRLELSDQPLRVTCPGGVRPEKGMARLYESVAPLWHSYFETQRLQLVLQTKRIGKLPPELRAAVRLQGRNVNMPGSSPSPPSVAVVPWPLSTAAYLDLIRNSHIGLLLYDADQYYARCSGVMVEMLKAGVPVIVPAGCWMAEQINESIFAYRDQLCEGARIVQRMTSAEVDWEAGPARRLDPSSGDLRLGVGGVDATISTTLVAPADATHLCVRFRRPASSPRGSYLELATKTERMDGAPPPAHREILGIRTAGRPVASLQAISPATSKLRLTWRNAYADQWLELEEVEFVFLSIPRSCCPLGAVGLVAAGVDQIPRLLSDIADNYAHYRQTAEEFAPNWGAWHSPERVVRVLTGRDAAAPRSVA